MRGNTRSSDDVDIIVLKRNLVAEQLYEACELTRVGMGGYCTGISSNEIRAALEAHRIPKQKWPRLTRQVQMMGRAAAKYINEEAEKARTRNANH